MGPKIVLTSFVEIQAQIMYKIENRRPIRAFVPEIAIPTSQQGGLELVVCSTRKVFLTSFVALVAQITYEIENR